MAKRWCTFADAQVRLLQCLLHVIVCMHMQPCESFGHDFHASFQMCRFCAHGDAAGELLVVALFEMYVQHFVSVYTNVSVLGPPMI